MALLPRQESSSRVSIADSSTDFTVKREGGRMLCLSYARSLLEKDYLEVETGHGLTADNMHHVTASTYMPGVTASMIDWWFGYIHITEQYKLWYPTKHVFSDWEGLERTIHNTLEVPTLFTSTSVEYSPNLKLSFIDPSEYLGKDWREAFEKHNYAAAVGGKVQPWEPASGNIESIGYLIHLVKNEGDGCRMRSSFWLGDVEGSPTNVGDKVPDFMTIGLMKHASEEMAILASKLPALYEKLRK